MDRGPKQINAELDDSTVDSVAALSARARQDVINLASSTVRPHYSLAKLLWDARADATAGKDAVAISSGDEGSLPKAIRLPEPAYYQGLPCEMWTRAHWVHYFWDHGKQLITDASSRIDATPLPADTCINGLDAARRHYVTQHPPFVTGIRRTCLGARKTVELADSNGQVRPDALTAEIVFRP